MPLEEGLIQCSESHNDCQDCLEATVDKCKKLWFRAADADLNDKSQFKVYQEKFARIGPFAPRKAVTRELSPRCQIAQVKISPRCRAEEG